MPKVFISHSNQDDESTLELVEQLRRAGFATWVDFENSRGGSDWLCEFQAGIKRCDALITILSKAALKSVWVERECLYAFQLGKPVLTALIDDLRLPLQLINIPYCDCRADIVKGAIELAQGLEDILTGASAPNYARDEVSSLPNVANFFPYLEQLPEGELAAEVARDLFEWAQSTVDEIAFGGKVNPACHVRLMLKDKPATLFTIRAYPRTPSLQLPFDQLGARPPFKSKGARRDLLKRLNRLLPRKSRMAADAVDRRPTIPLAALSCAEKRQALKAILGEVADSLRAGD